MGVPNAPEGPDPAPSPASDRAAQQAIARDLAATEGKWRAQAEALRAALPAENPPARGSERWAQAQVELSRLEILGAELADIAARAASLPAISSDVAARADAAVDQHRATALAAVTKLDR